jgi:hypothetical protein
MVKIPGNSHFPSPMVLQFLKQKKYEPNLVDGTTIPLGGHMKIQSTYMSLVVEHHAERQ